jgi:replicative DNA helicase
VKAPSEIMDGVPPQNLEAERGVLGSVLLDPRLFDEVATIVKPEDFYGDANRRIYSAMLGMHDRAERIDALLMVERLRHEGNLEAVGGVAYLVEVTNSAPVAQHAAYYARIVVEKALRRSVIHAATLMLQEAWDEHSTVEGMVGRCEMALQQISTGEYQGEPVELARALVDAMSSIDAIAARKHSAGVMIGLSNFDLKAGGFFPGELIILAARPSIGKTSLALQVAKHVGRTAPVYFASLEMPTTQLAMRMLCGGSGVPMVRVRSASLGPDDLALMSKAGSDLHGLQVVLHDRPGLSVQDVRRACRRLHAKSGLGLVVVDYLQRVTPHDRRMDRHLQVGQITWDLKALAMEIQVPVLCLCQLARTAGEREKKTGNVIEPRLEMLKESGDIEQDADMVLLLHRQHRESDSVMIMAKNRQGEQARFNLTWDGTTTTFSPGSSKEF